MAIDLLIVTGAGASANLSNDQQQPIAQMSQWADEIISELRTVNPSLPGEIGLRSGMNGEQFEDALGTFLAWTRALPIVEKLKNAGAEVIGQPQPAIDAFFKTSTSRSVEALRAVHSALYRLFNRDRFSTVSTPAAYEALLKLADVQASETVAFATTNYDLSLEIGLGRLGRKAITGEHVDPATGQRSIDVAGLIDDARPNRAPVLYLHGRLGWYVDPSQTLIAVPAAPNYQEDIGTPAILLPDPNKDYSVFPFTAVIWQQFREAAASAKRVLVVGHSLHDQALVQALQGGNERRVVVGIWIGLDAEATSREISRVKELIPGAGTLRLDFGPHLSHEGSEDFNSWVRRQGLQTVRRLAADRGIGADE